MNLRSPAAAALAWLALLSSGMACAAGPEAAPDRPSYWRERTSQFRTFTRHAEVVMIGDSLTDGAEWREMFPGQDIVNRGIDSDTTDGVLARLDEILSLKPQVAFLMIGINDFANAHRSVAAVSDNYRAIVARLSRAGIRVVMQSTLPCNVVKGAWKSCALINGKIAQLNARLATLASAGVAFVDLTPQLAGAGGLKAEFTFDGIHLNGEGYRRWKDAIARYMPPPTAAPRQTP